MGDIKKLRKKYETPRHPWNATRIKLEKSIMRKYGVTNKKEIWKMESVLKSFKDQAKSLLVRTDDQSNKEREQMIARMARLGLIKKDGGVDDILGLQLKDVMDRRLQTLVLKNRLARSVKHARQLITHEHITVDGRKITSPSYLVLAEEENAVSYSADSPYNGDGHPERFDEQVAQAKLARQKAKADRKGEELDEIVVFDAIEDPDENKTESYDASIADLKGVDDEKPAEKPKKAPAKKAEKKESKKKPEEKPDEKAKEAESPKEEPKPEEKPKEAPAEAPKKESKADDSKKATPEPEKKE